MDPITQLIIQLIIAFGIQKLQQKQAEADAKKQRKKNAGRQLTVQYGEEQPRKVAIGTICDAGHEVYRNTYGKANKMLEIVYRLSDFQETSLERVAIDGKWVNLSSPDANGFRTVTNGRYAANAFVRFVDGTQTAVPAGGKVGLPGEGSLVQTSNPAGRWTADHIGHGVSYVILKVRTNTKDPLEEISNIRFERKGAPLYDWRKDDTAGGTGDHRWNDKSTWEYAENPILATYTYMRGGFEYGDEIFLGMDIEPDWLPISKWTTAADLCDQDVTFTDDGVSKTEKRYRVSYTLSSDIEHAQNIDNLLDACAGMLSVGVNSVYPVINALYDSVATLTDADLIDGEPIEFDRDGNFSDRVNEVAGTYAEPEELYENLPYTTIKSTAGRVLDIRARDVGLDLQMVPSKRQAEQLATLYLNESRFPATKTVTVDPKWQVLEPGIDFITWDGDVDGTDRLYQVVGIAVMGDDNRVPRAVKLSLQERHPDVYAAIGPIERPILPSEPGEPELVDEAQDFAVTNVFLEQQNGSGVRPAIYCSWTAVEDITLDDVLIEYWAADQSGIVFEERIVYETGRAYLQRGVMSNTDYVVRHKVVSPIRETIFSAEFYVTTGNATSDENVLIGNIGADVRETISRLRADLDALKLRDTPLGFQDFNLSLVDGFQRFQSVATRAKNAAAAVIQEATVRASEDSALASLITAVQASVDDATAEGLFKVEAVAAPDEADVRIALFARATIDGGETYKQAGFFIDVNLTANGGTSRIAMAADQIVFLDGSGNAFALFEDGETFLQSARIPNLSADKITTGSLNADRIGVGTLTADKFVINGLTGSASASASDSSPVTSSSVNFVTISGFVMTVTAGADDKIMLHLSALLSNSSSGGQNDLRITRNNVEIITNYYTGGYVPSGANYTGVVSLIDQPGAGTFTYRGQWRQRSGVSFGIIRSRSFWHMRFRA